jgi:hypothetical protein
MNSKDIITSIPNTIKYYDNYLKDYINTSGFKWDSKCLEVVLKNIGKNFEKYVQKVNDYNIVGAFNPEFIPSRTYDKKEYNKKCPENWTYNSNLDGCVNPFYNSKPFGDNKCSAGRSALMTKMKNCPDGNFKYYYTEWQGPNDASKINNLNTNIKNKKPGEGSYCTAGKNSWWSKGGSFLDCYYDGGTWVDYYDDPDFNNNGYTCYKQNEKFWKTENATNFNNYSDKDKLNWENECQAYWSVKKITIPEKWICKYGETLENDISNARIFEIGSANSPIEAAKMALNSNRMIDNYFFMVDNKVYIIGKNNDIGVITSKGIYEPNCKENNNKKGTLFMINNEFFKFLENCKVINDTLNDLNINRDILKNSISDLNENFSGENGDQIIENFSNEDIIKNQNEIIANLTSNYNKKAELYNYQVDIISQNEKIVEVYNKKLNKQLNDLTEIQEKIALKNRVIELNEELTKKQIRNKKILIGFFVLLPFLIIPLLLIAKNGLNPFIGFGIAGLIIVGYLIYLIIIYKVYAIKKFKVEYKKVLSKYEKAITKYWEEQKKDLKNYLNEKCPDSNAGIGGSGGSDPNEEENDVSGRSDPNEEENDISGVYPRGEFLIKSNSPFYYYDGSAPPQQIFPGAIGSIDFSIEGGNYKFPKEIKLKMNEIKNPITKFFFMIWISMLENKGINVNDPNLVQNLDIIDFTD